MPSAGESLARLLACSIDRSLAPSGGGELSDSMAGSIERKPEAPEEDQMKTIEISPNDSSLLDSQPCLVHATFRGYA